MANFIFSQSWVTNAIHRCADLQRFPSVDLPFDVGFFILAPTPHLRFCHTAKMSPPNLACLSLGIRLIVHGGNRRIVPAAAAVTHADISWLQPSRYCDFYPCGLLAGLQRKITPQAPHATSVKRHWNMQQFRPVKARQNYADK